MKNNVSTVIERIFAVFFFVLLSLTLYECSRKLPERELIRKQFHLPGDIHFKKIDVYGKDRLVSPPRINAVVKFSDMQFNNYLQNLENRNVWKAVPLSYYTQDIWGNYTTTFDGEASMEAFQWQNIPANEDGMPLSKSICFIWFQSAESQKYQAVSCDQKPYKYNKIVFARGILNLKDKSLEISFH